jgi:hypothetical protein
VINPRINARFIAAKIELTAIQDEYAPDVTRRIAVAAARAAYEYAHAYQEAFKEHARRHPTNPGAWRWAWVEALAAAQDAYGISNAARCVVAIQPKDDAPRVWSLESYHVSRVYPHTREGFDAWYRDAWRMDTYDMGVFP